MKIYTDEEIYKAALAVFESHKYQPPMHPRSAIGSKIIERIAKDLRIAFGALLHSDKNVDEM